MIVLRYFNPSGAHVSGVLGEDRTQPPMNIMPIICHVAQRRRDHLTIFGHDYETTDGTCNRTIIVDFKTLCFYSKTLYLIIFIWV